MFTTSSAGNIEAIDCVPRKLSEAQNSRLLKEITDDEVRMDLFQMNPDKAPGHDGMTPGFFQKHWDIVGPDIIWITKQFFTTGDIVHGLNATNLVLIPKRSNRQWWGSSDI